MAKQVLSDRLLKSLKPAPAGKRVDLMDAIVPGLGLRVTDKGQKTFVLVTRFPGSRNPTRRALGEYGALTLEGARNKAREWHELIGKGVDPAGEKRRVVEAARQADEEAKANGFATVAEEFLRRHVKGQRKAKEVDRDVRKELVAKWGDKPISEITRRDVVEVVESIADRGAPYQAHNVLGHIRTLFNWAINRGTYGLEGSPVDRIKPATLIGAKEARQRVLNDDEVAALWRATAQTAYPFGDLCRLLLLTGQRKSEVSDARWPEFDFRSRLWTIPPERFKSDATHTVPLSDDALVILNGLPRFRGDCLFSTTGGLKPVNGFSKAKERLDRLMSEDLGRTVEPWVLHDIRRTVRTRLSGLRIPEPVAEMVIGHGRKGLARVYDQHKYLDEMREALEAWAGRLRSIVDPPPANVVRLDARA